MPPYSAQQRLYGRKTASHKRLNPFLHDFYNSQEMNRTLDDIRSAFEHYLSLMDMPGEPEKLYAPFVYAMSNGGKRLRPTLLLAAYDLYSDDLAPALPAAAAVEVFHNFTLLHDDVMDNAAVRRGRPSVFAKWGLNTALLSGDVMLIAAYKLLQRSPAHLLPRLLDVFNTMAVQVCEGQQYDMDFESRAKISVVEYMRMIELKTSALLGGAVTLGAVLGGASDEDCRNLERYAVEMGMAFQLQDDLLDCYGDEKLLGKRIGGDILEGKKTFLMIMAMSLADEQQRSVLRTAHLDRTLSDEQKIARVREIYDALEVPRIAEQQISGRFDRALTALSTLSTAAGPATALTAIAESLTGRKK